MEGFNSYSDLKEERKRLKRQRQIMGDEIQNGFLTIGRTAQKGPWYKNVGTWVMIGDMAYEAYKKFSSSKK